MWNEGERQHQSPTARLKAARGTERYARAVKRVQGAARAIVRQSEARETWWTQTWHDLALVPGQVTPIGTG